METLLQAIEEASPDAKRGVRVTKTALARLRVDQLRALAEQLGADSRGTKDAVVQRLLQAAGSEQAAAAAQAAAAERHGAADGAEPSKGG